MAKKKLTLEDVLVPKDEIPYEVPENWCWVKYDSIIENLSSSTKKIKQKEYLKEGIYPVIDQGSSLIGGYTNDENLLYDGELPVIIFGDHTRCVKYVDFKFAQGADGVKVLKPKGDIDIKYIYYLMLNLELPNKGYSRHYKFLREAKFQIPPLAEQERIVNMIESLFDKVDKAAGLVDEAREGFEKRRAAILERAFSGELTKKWREENDFSVEYILPNIGDLNRAEKKKFEFSEASEIFDIPSNWKWMKLKDLCTKFKYGTSAKSQPEGSVPVLRMGNLQGGVIDWNNLVYTSNEDEIKKYDLLKGDLLFNRTNSPELVGKTSIYMGEREAIYAGYLIRVRTYEGVSSKYVNYFMNSTFAKARCYEVKTDGVSQSNINAEKLGDFDIPLPSIEEQNEIVRILDRLLDKERVIVEVSDVYDSIDVIKKSILAKAFRGELGSNDLGEESSIELLKNIIK